MRIRPSVFIAVVAVLGLLIAGRFLGWYGGKPNNTVDAAPAPAAGSTVQPTAVTVSPSPPAATPVTVPAATPVPRPARPRTAATVPVPAPAPAAAAGLITDWEQRIDNILTTEGN